MTNLGLVQTSRVLVQKVGYGHHQIRLVCWGSVRVCVRTVLDRAHVQYIDAQHSLLLKTHNTRTYTTQKKRTYTTHMHRSRL